MSASLERVLVIGAGSVGRRHLRNARQVWPHADLICCRLTPTATDPELKQLTHAVTNDLRDAEAMRPDAVIVAGPAPTHAASAGPFLRAGIPVLLEKPMASTLADADAILSDQKAGGGVLAIGYMLRFHPLLRESAGLISNGRLGRIVSITASVGQYLPDWRPGSDWRAGVSARADLGGGVLLELSHEFDLLRWFGGATSRVACFLGSGLELPVEDAADVIVQFTGGHHASAHLDMLQRPPHREVRVIGTSGTLCVDLLKQQMTVTDVAGADAVCRVLEGFERNDLFVAELRDFDGRRSGQPSVGATGEDGREALVLALAARDSARKGEMIHV